MQKKGFTLIELLIVVAIIAILAAIAVPNFLEAQVRSKVSRVRADLRSYATAIESYYVDNNEYPATDSSDNDGSSGFGYNNFAGGFGMVRNMPTFRLKANSGDQLHTLTTPVAYLTTQFLDPFVDTKGATFSYSTPQFTLGIITEASGWIMWSYGPDVDQNRENQFPGGGGHGGDIVVVVAGQESARVETSFYNPSQSVPSTNLLTFGTYDPTNGTTSEGDVWRVKQ